ncbi:unnamed protein product [Prorocentrum cordatum]|uniref:5'-nucleotidase n=1 Tax=Prorocentrum cordatum TaxID=2364126 RepID=A0ABN9PGG2_9DINO|nr:unnamed protein product [Polarella glacialis]
MAVQEAHHTRIISKLVFQRVAVLCSTMSRDSSLANAAMATALPLSDEAVRPARGIILASGRAFKATVNTDKVDLRYYNIHNRDISRRQGAHILRSLRPGTEWAQQDSRSCLLIVSGDMNFASCSKLDLLQQQRKSSLGKRNNSCCYASKWKEVLDSLVDLSTDNLAHL